MKDSCYWKCFVGWLALHMSYSSLPTGQIISLASASCCRFNVFLIWLPIMLNCTNAVYRSSVLDIAAIENISKAALLGCQQSDKLLKPKADTSGSHICCTIRLPNG